MQVISLLENYSNCSSNELQYALCLKYAAYGFEWRQRGFYSRPCGLSWLHMTVFLLPQIPVSKTQHICLNYSIIQNTHGDNSNSSDLLFNLDAV